MTRLIPLLLLAAACTPAQWRSVDRGTLVTSTLLLAADGAQTMSAALTRHDKYEENPLMTDRPPPLLVGGYFAFCISVNALVWLAVPPRYRSMLPLGVAVAQAVQVRQNLATTCVFGVGNC